MKTSILAFTRGGKTDDVWFYEVGADGFTLDARRTERPQNSDLWDMTLKYRLRHAAAFRKPAPAFVDADTWRQWTEMASQDRSQSYAQPRIVGDMEEAEGEMVSIRKYKGLDTKELHDVKDWAAPTADIEADSRNLSAGRYKPLVQTTLEYPPPAQLIRELQAIEERIQAGLGILLTMVELEK